MKKYLLVLLLLLYLPFGLANINVICSPSTVSPGGSTNCNLQLSGVSTTISSVTFTIDLTPATLLTIPSNALSNLPTGFVVIQSGNGFTVYTTNLGERPSTLGTLRLNAGASTGSTQVGMTVTQAEDDNGQDIRTQLGYVSSATVTVQAANLCSPNPCQNGGTCTASGSTYSCSCVGGYTGTNCQTPPAVPVCTGPVPANSQLCLGDDQGLDIDTPRTLVPSCTVGTFCEYTCLSGYSNANGRSSDGCEQVVSPADTSGPGVLAYRIIYLSSTSARLFVQIDEPGECRYDLSPRTGSYDVMVNQMTPDTTNTIFTADITGLTTSTINYYVNCRDLLGNEWNRAPLMFPLTASSTDCTTSAWDCTRVLTSCLPTAVNNQIVFNEYLDCDLQDTSCTNPDAVRVNSRACTPNAIERLVGHLWAIVDGLTYTSETGTVSDYSVLESDPNTSRLRKITALARALVGLS